MDINIETKLYKYIDSSRTLLLLNSLGVNIDSYSEEEYTLSAEGANPISLTSTAGAIIISTEDFDITGDINKTVSGLLIIVSPVTIQLSNPGSTSITARVLLFN
jgi:hypothetical protein